MEAISRMDILKHNGSRVSMYVAFAASILLPILETIRRWDQLAEPRYFITWFDDYIIGGFLFFWRMENIQVYNKWS
jgi:hypothetical protein